MGVIWLCISLAASSNTPIQSLPSQTQEPTATSDLCQVSKPQSLQLTLAETGPHFAEFPSPILRDDVLNSGPQTQPATPTWRFLLSCKLVWTELRTRCTLAILATSTCTKLLLQNLQQLA